MIQVTFDPSILTYKKLLQSFTEGHNPTQKNGQGGDIGSQYRSGIYAHNKQQKQEAQAHLAEIQSNYQVRLQICSFQFYSLSSILAYINACWVRRQNYIPGCQFSPQVVITCIASSGHLVMFSKQFKKNVHPTLMTEAMLQNIKALKIDCHLRQGIWIVASSMSLTNQNQFGFHQLQKPGLGPMTSRRD